VDQKKIFFIYNPQAGKGQIKNYLLDVIEVFAKTGYEICIYPTKCQGDAINVVKNLKDDYDLLVCSGGDGTLDEVVTGMMQRKTRLPIGYIPAGSTNDFAKSLGIGKSMKSAAQAIVYGKNFSCDVGSFNHDTFIYIAAFGLFTDVSYETKQEAKNMLGHMAYILEGVKRLSAIKSYHMKVCYDDTEIEDDFIYGMVTNSVSVGGFKRITGKNVELDDGLFEVTLIKEPKNPMELNNTISAILVGDIDAACMYCFKTAKISFETKSKVPWTLDGEFGGKHSKVLVENKPKAIDIRVL